VLGTGVPSVSPTYQGFILNPHWIPLTIHDHGPDIEFYPGRADQLRTE
jgi:hypothetical protein